MAGILSFLREEDGPTAVEYAVMLALIIAVCIAAIGTVGQRASTLWGSDSSEISSALDTGS
jgi:pilus assembly protein Flp/PilA